MDGEDMGASGSSVRTARAAVWLRNGFVPSLPGPGAWHTTIALLVLANATLLVLPGPTTALAVGVLLATTSLAYAVKSRRRGRESLSLAAMAILVLFWVAWLDTGIAGVQSALVCHTAVSAAAIIAAIARHLAIRRHVLTTVAEASVDWQVGDMVAYAELLRDRRHCPGAREAARMLYRRASERILDRPWPERRDVRIIERYASLLGERAMSATDRNAAMWWMEKARELGRFAIGPDQVGETVGTTGIMADTAPVPFDAPAYDQGVPVWRIRTANADALLDGEAVFRAFLLPEGALLACLVHFESVVGQTLSLHRVFDVTDPEIETYLAASEHHLRWRAEIYDAKNCPETDTVPLFEPDAIREVNLRDSGLLEAFEQVLAHNAALGVHADVGYAHSFLTATFRDYAAAYGIEAAWSALEAACTRVSE